MSVIFAFNDKETVFRFQVAQELEVQLLVPAFGTALFFYGLIDSQPRLLH